MQLQNVGAKLAANKKNEKDETRIHWLYFHMKLSLYENSSTDN